MKNRKQYFKDKAPAMIFLFGLFILSLFTMSDASTEWRIAAPSFFFGINLGIVVYGLFIKKYRK